MTSILKFLGIFIAGAVIGALIVSATGGSLGGVYTQVNNTFRQGIKVGTNDQFQVSSTGNVSVTPVTGAATSSIAVGCVQANATSSATKVKEIFSTAGATSTFAGTVYFAYGTCP